jgi:hypothetical protein
MAPTGQFSMQVMQAQSQHEPRIAAFLRDTFGSDAPAKFFDAGFMRWKFFEQHPEWSGGRSYVIEQQDGIVAHACVWPGLHAAHLIDWAASPSAAGAGIAVYRHLMQLAGLVIAIGGSTAARRVLPKIGFKPYGAVEIFARPVRPWRQFQTRPRTNLLRETARLVHHGFWNCVPHHTAPAEWTAHPAARATLQFPGARSPAVVNYILECPIAKLRYFVISCHGTPRGYFLLNLCGGQCRIVDIFAASDWEAAYRLAIHTAAALPDTCEISAFSSLPRTSILLQAEGFQKRDERPVMVYDPEVRLQSAPPLNLQMVDSDAFFLYSPSYPYLT